MVSVEYNCYTSWCLMWCFDCLLNNCLFICLFVFVCLFVVCLFVCLFVCLSVCLFHLFFVSTFCLTNKFDSTSLDILLYGEEKLHHCVREKCKYIIPKMFFMCLPIYWYDCYFPLPLQSENDVKQIVIISK